MWDDVIPYYLDPGPALVLLHVVAETAVEIHHHTKCIKSRFSFKIVS